MANEVYLQQRQGDIMKRRTITPTANGEIGFDASGKLSNVPRTAYTVATLPPAASNTGRVLYTSNGSAGAPAAVISDGTNWKVIALGANAAAA